MDVNECIVKNLELLGVDYVFGGSGQVNASMLLSLKKSEKIKTVIVRNEQAASFMACGYAMFSDKLGVCFATGGPGAFNLFSGMAVALSDSLPILGISGYTSKQNRGKGALNEASGYNRTPDAHKMFSLTTKKSYIIEHADDTCPVLEQAINTAVNGRPGPVHIHIPKNITYATVNNFYKIKIEKKQVLPDSKTIDQFVTLLTDTLKNNRQIIILIGYGAVRSHAEKEILDFVECFNIPFATTMDAKGILPENHPLSLGVFGASGDNGAIKYFNSSAVILAMGNSFAQNATFGFKDDLFKNKILLHINIDENDINKVYKADAGMVSDIKPAVSEIFRKLHKTPHDNTRIKLKRDKYYDTIIDYTGKKIHPGQLVQKISLHLPPDSIVLGDAGAHMLWLNCYLSLEKNQRYQNPGSFGPMASHVNGAIGVKAAHPDKHVICGCGDGAYLMSGFELVTAVQYNIPVIWIIFNNGEQNIIKKILLNMYGRHAFMEVKNPDYVMYAKACGALGFRVERLEEFEPVFKKALDSLKPCLIDVIVESEVYPPFELGWV